jgi:hypothetical protein
LLSYFVVVHNRNAVPIHGGDARINEPLSSNGLAIKKGPHFYPLYTGPQRPDLNGIQATGYTSAGNLILNGWVDGPIQAHPQTTADGAIYTFVIDRGGSSKFGPFPGRPHIRFDTVVQISVTPSGVSASLALNNPQTNQPGAPAKALPSSSVSIDGNHVQISVPLSKLPSTGYATNQWNVNFYTRNPAQPANFHSIASFTPEYTEFQVFESKP